MVEGRWRLLMNDSYEDLCLRLTRHPNDELRPWFDEHYARRL